MTCSPAGNRLPLHPKSEPPQVAGQRKMVDPAHRADAGHGRHAIQRFAKKLRAFRRRCVGRTRHVDRHAEHVMRVEPRIHRAQIPEAADHQPRPRKQHQRDRHFAHHQQTSQSPALTRRPSGRLFQCRVQIGPRGLQSRRNSEQQRGNGRNCHREQQYRNAHADLVVVTRRHVSDWLPEWSLGERVNRPIRQQQAKRHAGHRKEAALSASNCRTIRHRLAPMAARKAISFCRPVARATAADWPHYRTRSITETLRQPAQHQQRRPDFPHHFLVERGVTRAPASVFVLGYSSSIRRAMALICLRACSSETPSRSRAKTRSDRPSRSCRRHGLER